MPSSTEETAERLVAARDHGERQLDEASQFIGSECRVALYAFIHGNNAIARDELLGGMQYLRLLSETAIRVGWIAGDSHEAGPDGYTVVDPAAATSRIESMRKRDLLLLASASRAIRQSSGSVVEDISASLEISADQIAEPPAPVDLRTMATSVPGLNMYAVHRLCSAVVHPGAGIGRPQLMSRDALQKMTEASGTVCGGLAVAVLRNLGST